MKTDQTYWRSLDELENSEEIQKYLENEFPELLEGQSEELVDPLNRRRFMQLMGASLAFAGVAGAAGCRRWEEEKIVPLSRQPGNYIPGVPKRYASAMELGGVSTGVLVTSFDGRPIKIEGNPDHPFSGGASTAFAQASVLELYDPDRAQAVARRDGGKRVRADWAAFESAVDELAKKGPGARVRVLTDGSISPTLGRALGALQQRFRQLELHWWSPLNRDNERAGTSLVFGGPVRPQYDLSKADVVLALDADIFVDHPAALAHGRGFAARRRPDQGDMSRLYAVESVFSSTGAVADHRLPLRSELILPFVMALNARINGGPAPNAPFLSEPKIAAFLEALADDLKEGRGKTVIVAGHRQPPEVHALVAQLNAASTNGPVSYIQDPEGNRPSHAETLAELAADLEAGTVDALVILGGNPVYDAPADLKLGDKIAKAETSIHLSLYENETSVKCNWLLPAAHYLESWADGLSWDGTYTLTQPVIEPLYEGKTALDLIALLAGVQVQNTRDLIREQFDELSQAPLGGADKAWNKAVHDGFLGRALFQRVSPSPRPIADPQLTARQQGGLTPPDGTVEVVFTASSHTYDGRFANSSWLQETPDFMTKATWDNVALISPLTASKLKIDNFTKIKVTVGEEQLELPAYVMPGQAPYSVAIALGHGRTRAGQVGGLVEVAADGSKDVVVAPKGFDAYKIRTAEALWIATGTLKATGSSYPVATTQDHWNIDQRGQKAIADRMNDLIREGTLEEYKAHMEKWESADRSKVDVPDFNYKRHLDNLKIESLWKPPVEYDGHKWGMATDLSKCIGCNACMVACQAENNIPVVGKREVMRSREMHWLRIDRYFSGDMDDPEVLHQPVTCQHCENAPCEQVCPVGATIHSDEGLNDMVYNRCVGTRYCANNCPYKVRRFNFFDYHKDLTEARSKVRKLLFNPEVTVRSRGVMEKCTFCVQRIAAVKIPATNDKRSITDGEIVTACQQACPTGAIVFGDLNDKDGEVAKLHASDRAYSMLGELNVKPRNQYLARIKNLNPKLAKQA
ncbi:MAG TPA: TAT-variant-translocated molybdopterin oxidoreductase [Kofleriaceae bacterium]|nr:TAT-variant-translocated molybdopterin oxidoreductase [Kofleriaceae bacterium]